MDVKAYNRATIFKLSTFFVQVPRLGSVRKHHMDCKAFGA